ncbi:hypothetical protein H0H81_005479 [Sphagnurus paluster]|uniref:CBS domain-containing protein n=1 Tax=Sphagnurus paluster TaxID=117069 RepID=A0A9P7FXQ5_9AGAR|nr:hypothetical protein H0H81_005479 [Sphagnurus paluster]
MAAVSSTPTPTIHSTALPTFAGPADKYRGAVVEDLQLPPAFSLPSTEAISRAIELAYERDFSHLPVLDRHRRPVGYVDVANLKEKWEAGQADPNSKVVDHMTKFRRTASEPYTVVTPLTSLADLEAFLKMNLFALGEVRSNLSRAKIITFFDL